MAAFYLEIKLVHIGLVLASGVLFALRGLLLQLGQRWVLAPSIRRASIVLDTLLLLSALLLLAILRLNPFTTPWLATKLILLGVYISLGVIALWRGRSRTTRLGALLVFVFIYSVARAHHPLGFLLPLFG